MTRYLVPLPEIMSLYDIIVRWEQKRKIGVAEVALTVRLVLSSYPAAKVRQK